MKKNVVLAMILFLALCSFFMLALGERLWSLGFFSLNFLVLIWECRKNSFFMFRLGFVYVIVVISVLNVFLGFDVSPNLKEAQTIQIADIALIGGVLGLNSAWLGLALGEAVRFSGIQRRYVYTSLDFWLIAAMCFAVSYLIAQTRPLVFDLAYGADFERNAISSLGALNTLATALLLILVHIFTMLKVNSRVGNSFHLLVVLSIFSYLVIYAEFLRGMRMDAFTNIIAVTFYWYLLRRNKFPELKLKLLLVLLCLFLLSQIWGVVRSSDLSLVVIDSNLLFSTFMMESERASVLIYQGTFNDIASTYLGAIYLIENNIESLWFGESYFNYFLRTPPEFLWPDRPDTLSLLFKKHMLISGGGFFELGEGYLNFGMLGLIFHSFIISFYTGLSYKLAVSKRGSLLFSLPLIAILSCFFRGYLYESFVFYKSFLIVSILFLFLYSFSYISRHVYTFKRTLIGGFSILIFGDL